MTMIREVRSIHYRRRWYYVLWSVLLLVSLVALCFWEIPSRTGRAKVQFQVTVAHVPQGCRVRVWAGSSKDWHGSLPDRGGLRAEPFMSEGRTEFTLELPVAYRRWTGTYMTKQTFEYVVIAIVPPTGTSRYAAFPLSSDWNSGLLKPGRKLKIVMDASWEALCDDPRWLSAIQ